MNIAHYLPRRAEQSPNQKAVYFQREEKAFTYLELEQESNRMAQGLKNLGIQKGDRIVLMVRCGFDFVALTFAIFKMGAVAVLIDPGIGTHYLSHCIKEVEPHGFIGIPKAHLLRLFWPFSFSTVKFQIVVGPKWFLGIQTLHHIKHKASSSFSMTQTQDHDLAAIIFTTGSTGIPKGVVYEHGMFDAQIKTLKEYYQIQEGEIDMPTFPLFALFSIAMGTTCIIPDMDPTQPALVDSQKIVKALQSHKVTYTFGSPALWNQVTQYCVKQRIRLPSIQRILIAGAPVAFTLLERFENILSHEANVYTPYGATEALPITSVGYQEILENTSKHSKQGQGICVGQAFLGVQIKIIRITDDAILNWDEALVLPLKMIGEIVVKGKMVTKSYFGRPNQTNLAKIKDKDGSIWHRMGDVGYIDEKNRLWFCGRKSHRVKTSHQTLFTIPCESIFNQHKEVFRSALVAVDKKPVIIIEPHDKHILKNKKYLLKLKEELLILARQYSHTQDIQDILFHASFPVDIRHNAKIGREKLALWAKEKLS